MLVVTGTKRSGTSLWMRMLVAAGLPHLGEEFPSTWGQSIREANPHGFYESGLRQGVYFATNPDPRTGRYLAAGPTRRHAVKVFIPGVVRTERAYLHRVVATMRHWRTYSRSIQALYQAEDAWLLANPRPGCTGADTVERVRASRPTVPAPVEWLVENYQLVRDFAVRRYPIHFTSYERLLDQPDAVVGTVFDWLGEDGRERALAAIDADLQRSASRPRSADEDRIEPRTERLLDALFEAVHDHSAIPRTLADALNDELLRHTLTRAGSSPRPDPSPSAGACPPRSDPPPAGSTAW